MTDKLQNIIIWAENKPGVLFRILWLFRKKQFNIESVTAGHSEMPGVTRITITVSENGHKLKNMCHQINKLVNVVKVEHILDEDLVF
ncbi:acetolactate synthase small subunit, partial [Candidatus Gottesmanbacteria bacterium RBG_16_38_7b]